MANSEHDISWAMKLLEREPEIEENLLSKYYHVTWGVLAGAGSHTLANFIYKRPLTAGFPYTVLFGGIGACVGAYLRTREDEILATRDAKLRHYIQLHPEDFPPPERKKFADILLPWVPVR